MSKNENGTTTDVKAFERPKQSKLKLRGQVSEILAVILFTCGVILILTRPNWFEPVFGVQFWLILSLLLVLFSVILFFCAVMFTYKSNQESVRIASISKYVITKQRIETLKAVRVPRDVRDFLSTLMEQSFNEEELLRRMEEALGPERTDETSSVVLKYTRVYVPRPPETKVDPPTRDLESEPASAAGATSST